VDFAFVAAIGGIAEVDIGARGGAFGDKVAGVLRCMLGDRLVDSVVSVLCVLLLRVALDLEIVLESVLECLFGIVIRGVFDSASKVDAVCALTVGDIM
jgi:hypothetical protein